MSKIKNKEINWSKVSGVGSSKSKKDKKEIFKGLWLAYLYVCVIVFLGLVTDIIDDTHTYFGNIKFFILFFIPCVVYLSYKMYKSFEYKEKYEKIIHDYNSLIPQYKFIKYEFLNREKEWQKVAGDITDLYISELDELNDSNETRYEIEKITDKIDKIEDERERRISYSDEEKEYPDDYFFDLRKLLGMKYGDNKYDRKIEEWD